MKDIEANPQMLPKLKIFCRINEQFRIAFEKTEKSSNFIRYHLDEIYIHYIGHELLHIPQYLGDIVTHFKEELPRLLSIAIFFDDEFYKFNQKRHILNCALLGRILKLRTDLSGYALKYFELYPAPFEDCLQYAATKKSKKDEKVNVTDLELVECCFSLLLHDPVFYKTKWNWSKFTNIYLKSPNFKVKWIAAQCIHLITNMNELQHKLFILSLVSQDQHDNLTFIYDQNSTLTEFLEKPPLDFQPIVNPSVGGVIQTKNIAGIFIQTVPHLFPIETNLIEVESTRNNLRKISLGSTLIKAVCIQGPVGCGKTTLVEYLAAKTGRIVGKDFVKIQLGDQVDSKMLLGTYRCTDIPGEFVWQAGVLTQAVTEGSWLLMEDIDAANMDVASILTSLLENETLSIPGFRDNVPITPGFQLFLTRRLILTVTGYYKKQSNAMGLMKKHLIEINIDPFSLAELKEIVMKKYFEFRFITDRLVEVFNLFNLENSNFSQYSAKNARLTSTRDFFKWCSRAIVGFDPKSQASALKVLQDAIDIFCCAHSNIVEALNLAKHISTLLGIVNHKAEYFCQVYKPPVELTVDSFKVGRTSMLRVQNEFVKNLKFSFTRPSAVLLERIMCCVISAEPVLLVGETGTGKTCTIQYLASTIGQKLVVINMNQQSDSADLLGGFKPVDLKFVLTPLKREFEEVFCEYFKVEPNRLFLNNISHCYNSGRWLDLVKLMYRSYEVAMSRLNERLLNQVQFGKRSLNEAEESKKLEKKKAIKVRWESIGEKLEKIHLQLKQKTALAFAFIEGTLVKAIQKGYWVLLDEINLANAETLECLSGLLEGSNGSLCLLEKGDKQPIERHPNFTLFACMNPSTDVGKRDLPASLRNRFTEFFVHELTEKNDLLLLTVSYLESLSLKEKELNNIVDFYLKVRREAEFNLLDGIGHKPHYSLRSLSRALSIAGKNLCGTLKRSLYEAFCLSFLTQLDVDSYQIVQNMIKSYLLGKDSEAKSILNQPIPKPIDVQGMNFIQFEGYWVQEGNLDGIIPEDYILTNSVRKNLKDLSRVVSIGKLPILLQGDTSVGKTSLITYLAKASGNKCVRINNHEHTDLQEYIGSYVADINGKLVFREGLLVEAMRHGHWIILDELNLAPTDVLEALNRVLDDNRELFIPETQLVVKAHHNFMLFATQNPPGAYGGRKMLSRAFRNRFVELHFTEIPPKELEIILHKRCQIAPSYANKMIGVMTELQMRRRGSAAFAGKQGFITLRDLFRWGERYRLAQTTDTLYDWDQHLADEGYLVLAGRVRKNEEKNEIVEVLKKYLKRHVNPENLFTLSDNTSTVTKKVLEDIYDKREKYKNIVWTYSMRQLAVLVAKGLQFKEPVLMVGETGGGKTTICKIIAENNGQELVTVNCHMHTESSDFIGGLRPVRSREGSDKLFEWVDGPLIEAMQKGSLFLADEISLADDSVLERLNSLLEPERFLLVAEKGADIDNQECYEVVKAHRDFYFVGTMNPGGDFGKKELSPALRNRFTEIWCEPCTSRNDLIAIVEANVKRGASFGNQEDGSSGIGRSIMDFVEWFRANEIGSKFTVSIRDVLTWVDFVNACAEPTETCEWYVHGAHLTFLDSFGSGTTSGENPKALETFKAKCVSFLNGQIGPEPSEVVGREGTQLQVIGDRIGIEPFFIDFEDRVDNVSEFFFNAPTTLTNAMRILRGMQLRKAILLEGSPGVGKTSLVKALAEFSGHDIYRINLSDQTDISDLFGADLPVEGGAGGQFSWRDGPLLQALKRGHWILLDELNLASQSVLEGLNACLDHRGEIFVPELGKTFSVKKGTRFFAAQNPLKQGGSRRGLPQSFLNRFIQVYVDALTQDDLLFILSKQFPQLSQDVIAKMVEFNRVLEAELSEHKFGHKGAPWECNLRDLTRWCEVTIFDGRSENFADFRPEALVDLIYRDRMRSLADKDRTREIFEGVFERKVSRHEPILYLSGDRVRLGDVCLRINECADSQLGRSNGLVLRSQLTVLRSLAYCVNLGWMSILVGSSGSGKSGVVKTLAKLAGKTLKIFPVTSAMDTTDILGGFEQTDYSRHLDELNRETGVIVNECLRSFLLAGEIQRAVTLLHLRESFAQLQGKEIKAIREEIQLFVRKLDKLGEIWDYLGGLDVDGVVEKLRRKAAILQESVTNEGSLNAGGKFEWVDSVLITCLQKGHWLLVDNVNLCSSAVLDRLNALLEPHGVLTIGERGVDQDGRLMEIEPHKEFRLFLTMDPKNGEISRAMRNRGAEIYILNERESATRNEHDLKSLVQVHGLRDRKLIRVLLHMHDFASDLILGEKPTVNELLHAASLISQQIAHGTDERQAFLTSLIEVYRKTRSTVEFATGDADETIAIELKLQLDSHDDDDVDWYNENFTVRCDPGNSSSEFRRFKQQSALLHSLLRGDVGLDNENVLVYLILLFYTISTKNDLESRFKYLKYILKERTDEYLPKLVEDMFRELNDRETFSDVDSPMDHRWLSDSISTDHRTSEVNYVILKLYLMVYYYNENKLINIEGSSVTLLDYIKSRKMNRIEDKFNDVIVNEFLDLLKTFDSHLDELARGGESASTLTNDALMRLLFLARWRFAFFRCALVDIRTKLEPTKLLTNIRVHYNWFLKYSVRSVSQLLNRNVGEDLNDVLCRINRVVDKQFSGLFKVGKNYQKLIDKPPPFTERSKIEDLTEYDKISRFYNICDRRNDVKKVFQMVDNDCNIRNILIDLKENHDIENLTEKIDVLRLTHSKNETNLSKELNIYKYQLMPFVDYLETLEIRRLISKRITDSNPSITNSFVIPTDLVALYSKYCATEDKRVCHELIKTYFLYVNDSPSVRPTAFLNQQENDSIPVDLNQHHPKLSYYLSNLLISSESNGMSISKLGNFRFLMKQHRSLNLNLWKNVMALQNNEYNFINLESSFIQNDSKTFLEHQLAASLNIRTTSSTSPQQTVRECISCIVEFGETVISDDHHGNIAKFTETLRRCYENVNDLLHLGNKTVTEKIHLISSIHTHLGYLKLILNAQLPLIDPLTKKSIKKEYCDQAVLDFERMKMCYELQNEVYSASPNTVHELRAPLREMIDGLKTKSHSLSEYVAARSENIEYETLLQSVHHAMSSIMSMKSFAKLEQVDSAIETLASAVNNETEMCSEVTEILLPQFVSSLASYENLLLDWSKFRISYPDIVEPLLCNVAQFLYGYKMKISLLQKSIRQYEFVRQRIHINETMSSLVKYPVLDDSQKDYAEQICTYTSEKTQKFIGSVFTDIELPQVADRENFRLLKCGIQEAFNACIVDGNSSELLNRELYSKFTDLVTKFVATYNAQQMKKEEQEKESENLYKTKHKCQDLTEKEQVEQELKILFPNFHTIDFSDMQVFVQMEDEHELCENTDKQYNNEISYEDLKFVSELHIAVVQNFTKSEWLNPDKNKSINCNFIDPLIQKFATFKQLMDKTITALDFTIDHELFGSFSVLLGVIQLYGNGNSLDEQVTSPARLLRNEYRNFYKDSDVEQVKSCFHILEELKKRMEELLDEWPEQPTLQTIVTVIERIYSFDITSPLSRFLTGFEILLCKCHEWEQVAHSGVSLCQYEQNLTQQIITWRKKELTMWKNLLNSTYDRLNDSAAKWWLYLFRVTEQFIVERLFSVEELITTLQTFITNSNIAEFQSRLDLLLVFHCYAVNFVESPKDNRARIYQSILWNAHQYYSQFRTSVVNKIRDLRAPIEKKLKDYVKIVKWKDISYWSVKETVDKSHKILHKHVREFKEVMSQPIAKYLLYSNAANNKVENVGIWDRPQRHTPKKYHYTIDASNYVAKKFALKKVDSKTESFIESESEMLNKIDFYFSKARKLCENIVEGTNYPNLVRDLDEFVSEIIETSSHLQNLEVDGTMPRNKQKSQAKGILQQKHRALADLFKSLNRIGLSFRTGIVDSSLRKNAEDFTIKPVDLKASIGHIGISRNDEKILTIWDSCELYFVRSLIRYNSLETALLQPAKDLGLNNVQRCRGYSAHLLSLSCKQKTEMIEMSRCLYYLKNYFNNMSRYCSYTEYFTLKNILALKKIMKNAIIVSNQYKIILNTCPTEDNLNLSPVEIVELKGINNTLMQYKYDAVWTKAYELFNDLIALSNKALSALRKCRSEIPCSDYQLDQPKVILVEDKKLILCNVDLILSKIDEILSIIKDTPLANSLKWLHSEILATKTDLKDSVSEGMAGPKDLQTEVESGSSKILLVIQEMFKKYSKKPKASSDEAIEEERRFDLKEDHLKNLLVENLSSDIKTMNVKDIMKSVGKVAVCVYSMKLPLNERSKLTIAQYLSLLDQAILLYQYFLTQQVSAYRVTSKLNSILLNVFGELAEKGFCVPPEFSEEMAEEGIGKQSDGMGLGDGQGEKDVSDKIESEDQLDETRIDGQEKGKEEEADCKEEDKGIDMSEDFDSKLQDKEKKEDEDENENDSNSDAEEQMGETGKGADKLDEEIWGSDKEDAEEASDEEEGKQEDEESGNKGEDEKEQHVGAKEKDSKNKPTNENKDEANEDGEENKKEINEMKEPEYDEEQADPYHRDLPEPPEPEPMDLPDDLKLDDGEENEAEHHEENPFDIDAMKEQNAPEGKEATAEDEKEDKQKDEIDEYSSDDEKINTDDNDQSQYQEEENDDGKGTEEMNEEVDTEENATEEDKAEEGDKVEDDAVERCASDQNQTTEDHVEAMEVDNSDAADKTEGADTQNKSSQPVDEFQQEDKPDKDGMGQSQMEEHQSGHSSQTDKPQQMDTASRDAAEEVKRKQKPGESDAKRSLGDVEEPVQKKLKTIDSKNEKERKEDEGAKEPEHDDKADAEMYEHIKDAKENSTQVLDVATQEQADEQKERTVPSKEEEEAENPTDSSKDLLEEEMKNDEMSDNVRQQSEKLEKQKEKKRDQKSHPDGEVLEELENVEIEGDVVETSTVARGAQSSYHTLFGDEKLKADGNLSVEEMNVVRMEVEQQMSSWYEPPSDVEAEQTWQKISSVTASLAQELSEQLRLVLEPTQASRLKGDYRTGRRINMRKVIPYVASQFRKDKIWLRRTKPSKREYQIVLAIDDSSSMADNRSKEMAFESVALISKALTLLESGRLSIVSFGEQTDVLHKLNDQFTEKSGVKILQKFKFDQTKTCLAKMVDFTTEMLAQSHVHSSSLTAKLLIIVSDGRGVFSEGETMMRQAVRRGKLANIFTVFVIIDNPENKNSVLDIRMPVFKDGKLLGIKNYMDVFPFSFYILLRDLVSLPNVLSDALRQWFEIVSNSDKH